MYTTLLTVFTSGEENGIWAGGKILNPLIPFLILLKNLTMGIYLFIVQVFLKKAF